MLGLGHYNVCIILNFFPSTRECHAGEMNDASAQSTHLLTIYVICTINPTCVYSI